jgi:hypothetical protein
MWFVNFVLIAAVLVTSLVLGWGHLPGALGFGAKGHRRGAAAHAKAETGRSAFARVGRGGTRGDAEGEGGVS